MSFVLGGVNFGIRLGILCCLCQPVTGQNISGGVQELYERALSSHDLPEKIRLLKKVLSSTPHYVDARLELARAYIDQAQYEDALVQVDSTLNYDRKNPYVWFEKGRAHASLSEHRAALKSIERAIRIKDDVPTFHLQVGQVRFRQKAFVDALKDFEHALSVAITVNDRDQQAEAWYWKALVHLTQSDTANAVNSFQKTVVLNPNHREARTQLAQIEELIQLETLYRQAIAAIEQQSWHQARGRLQDILKKAAEFKDAAKTLTMVQNEIEKMQRTPKIESESPPEEDTRLTSKSTSSLPRLSTTKIDSIGQEFVEETTAKELDTLIADLDSLRLESRPVTNAQERDLLVAASDSLRAPAQEKGDSSGHSPKLPLPDMLWVAIWLGGGAAFVVIATLSFRFYKRHKRAHWRHLQYAETKTVVVPKDVLRTELGRYRIERELGRGGMGKVYKANDLRLERPVALKVVNLETSANKEEVDERIDRFRREAKATAILNHPNIVSLYDYDEKNGVFYMTMEYVEGQSVQELLNTRKPLEIELAVRIVRETCLALEYAHRRHLVHRDIKPSNIMLNRDGQVKVLDFGIAKMLNLTQTQSPTMTGMRIGSPMYMSPEQINAGILDGRSDIFALGVVFYEMLTAKRPFNINEEDNLNRLFYVILETEPPQPSSVRKGLPSRLDAIVAKMLAKDPDMRYQNANDIVGHLASGTGPI